MKVIFLGCGYLGYNLSRELKKSFDVEVWGIDSPYVSRTEKFRTVDVFDPSAMSKMDFQDAIVIDTVALIGNNAVSDDDDLALDPILYKYRILFRALKNGGAKRYIFLSSGGTIYGNSLTPIDEGHILDPRTLYAKSKAALEELVQESGLDYLILRPANPYGGYQLTDKKQGVIPIMIEKALREQPFSMWVNSTSIRDYIYIDDFARALKLLLEKDISQEIINIASGEGTSLAQVIELVEKAVGKPLQIHHELNNVEVIQAIVLDISKLKTLTGYQPQVSLEEGIRLETERIKKEISL